MGVARTISVDEKPVSTNRSPTQKPKKVRFSEPEELADLVEIRDGTEDVEIDLPQNVDLDDDEQPSPLVDSSDDEAKGSG